MEEILLGLGIGLINTVRMLRLVHIESCFLGQVGLKSSIKVVQFSGIIKLEASFLEELVGLIENSDILRQSDVAVVSGHTEIQG